MKLWRKLQVGRHRSGRRGASAGARWWQAGLLTVLVLVGGMCVLGAAAVGGTAAVVADLTVSLPAYAQLQAAYAPDTFAVTNIYAQRPTADDPGWELLDEISDPLGADRVWQTAADLPAPIRAAAATAIGEWPYPPAVTVGWTNPPPDVALIHYLVTRQLLPADTPSNPTETDGWTAVRTLTQTRLAMEQVSRAYTAEQRLDWYLNAAYYGRFAYGLDAAAQVYFGRSAAELTVAEAALLGRVPLDPAVNPIDDLAGAQDAQAGLLERLLAQGDIDRDQFVAARFSPLTVNPPALSDTAARTAAAYAEQVRDELAVRFGPQAVLRRGLSVYTSLDLTAQQQARCAARAQVGRLSGVLGDGLPVDEAAQCAALNRMPSAVQVGVGTDRQVDEAAVVMIDPRTGHITAWVDQLTAGRTAGTVDRQPGTILQPFVYLTALSQGYTAASMTLDVENDLGTEYNGVPYVPQNADGQFRGPISVRRALANGYTVPAVQTLTWVGLDNMIRTAQKLGIRTLNDDPNRYGLPLLVGGGTVRPVDVAYAYAVLANEGTMVGRPTADEQAVFRELDPVLIVRVEDDEQQVVYEYEPQRREILAPELAYVLNDILADNSIRCQGQICPSTLTLPDGRPAAVHTGDTNDGRDAWTVGYTPQAATAVWVGNAAARPMEDVDGYTGAAPVWRGVMGWRLQDAPLEVWGRPANVGTQTVCVPSGLLPNGICPTREELFVRGTEPVLVDDMYRGLPVNRENGRLATIDTPPDLIEERTYVIYPPGAQEWAQAQGVAEPPTEYDTIRDPAGTDRVRLLEPRPFAYLSGDVPIAARIAPEIDLDYYRLAYFEGLTLQSLRTITQTDRRPDGEEPIAVWDVARLDGLYTLLLTVVDTDGRVTEVSAPVTVNGTPPEVTITAPRPDQVFAVDGATVTIRVRAEDDIGVDRVSFFEGEAGIPFEIDYSRPFEARWRIDGRPGCLTFRATAVDAAGNEAQSQRVTACVAE